MSGKALGLCCAKDGERWAFGGICSEKSDTFSCSPHCEEFGPITAEI